MVDLPNNTLIGEETEAHVTYLPKPSSKSLWHYIVSDWKRYCVTDQRSRLAVLFISSELVASAVYRWGHWIWTYSGVLSRLIRCLKPFYIIVNRFVEAFTSITIYPPARIGQGLYIGHIGSIHIGAEVVMGENCNISQEVTIGVGGRGEKRGSPVIGNRVFIAPGAKLFGPIVIGDDVAIGANSVVTKSLPDCAVAVGIPAKVVSYEGSFEFIMYDRMEHDQERLRNLAAYDAARSNSQNG